MFIMIDFHYKSTENFQSLSNMFKHYGKIVILSSIEYSAVKYFKYFFATDDHPI